MNIELNSQRTVAYRLSHYEREIVRDMINEMLESGVIRDSVSSYSSPMLIRK